MATRDDQVNERQSTCISTCLQPNNLLDLLHAQGFKEKKFIDSVDKFGSEVCPHGRHHPLLCSEKHILGSLLTKWIPVAEKLTLANSCVFACESVMSKVSSMLPLPKLEVMMRTAFLKLTTRPWLSVTRPSSNILGQHPNANRRGGNSERQRQKRCARHLLGTP